MLAFVSELSRTYCVGICAFLVPAILLLTIQSLFLGYFQTYGWRFRGSILGAIVLEMLLIAHVGTWFSIGVVTPVTFILLTLSLTCLAINSGLWMIADRQVCTDHQEQSPSDFELV